MAERLGLPPAHDRSTSIMYRQSQVTVARGARKNKIAALVSFGVSAG
jgi:hypothetical protein